MPGALAAWAGFTLPSALLLVAFASGAPALPRSAAGAGLLHGLQLVAVAVVAQAVWGMARTLCPDRPRAAIALAALAIATAAPVGAGQVAAILAGALAGLQWARAATAQQCRAPSLPPVSRRVGAVCLAAVRRRCWSCRRSCPARCSRVFDAFYRSGALVFGGGHVVLPLLHDATVVPGWVGERSFLAGYGATQAMPGPLFTFAAYLGAVLQDPAPGGAARGDRAAAGDLPARLLLLLGVLPFWQRCGCAQRCRPRCGAPTPPWSACWPPRSTTRSGPARCTHRQMPRWPPQDSVADRVARVTPRWSSSWCCGRYAPPLAIDPSSARMAGSQSLASGQMTGRR